MTATERKLPLELLPGFDRFITEGIRALAEGKVDPGAVQFLTASGSVNEGVIFVEQSGAAADVTIPDAEKAPGKWYLVRFSNAGGGRLLDEAGPHTLHDCTASNLGVVLVFSTGTQTLGTNGYLVFPIDDTN